MTRRDGPPAATPGDQPDEPPEEVPQQLVAELVAAATLAPSMHNTQPWRFRFEPARQTIELYADPDRMLRFGDPHGRAVHIACGAALFNLRLAAAVAGRQPVTRLTPARTQRLLLATVRLAGRCQAQPDEVELRAAIPRRRTNRSPFSARPVPPGTLAELREAARLEGAVLNFPDQAEVRRLLQLAQDAERELLADPGYRAELARWPAAPATRRASPRRRSPRTIRLAPRRSVTSARPGAGLPVRLVRGTAAASRAVH